MFVVYRSTHHQKYKKQQQSNLSHLSPLLGSAVLAGAVSSVVCGASGEVGPVWSQHFIQIYIPISIKCNENKSKRS
jgi:hypothetical protein